MAKKVEEKLEYTKYEKARMIGSRALQIAMGAPILVELSEQELENLRYNPIEIAKLEFDSDKMPMTVLRQKPQIEIKNA